jgi:hypothetical protein
MSLPAQAFANFSIPPVVEAASLVHSLLSHCLPSPGLSPFYGGRLKIFYQHIFNLQFYSENIFRGVSRRCTSPTKRSIIKYLTLHDRGPKE